LVNEREEEKRQKKRAKKMTKKKKKIKKSKKNWRITPDVYQQINSNHPGTRTRKLELERSTV